MSFFHSVHSKAFTEMSKIYSRSTFKSVGKSIILGARLPNAFLCGQSILVVQLMGSKAKVSGNEA